MRTLHHSNRSGLLGSIVAAVIALAAYSSTAWADEVKVMLSGDQEVPAVMTKAAGSGTITIHADKSVSGSVTTTGVVATMAHIHHAPPGKAGPVIIPMVKSGEATWSVVPGAKLSDEQFAAYKAGELYVNVHSMENKPGEIRGQLKP